MLESCRRQRVDDDVSLRSVQSGYSICMSSGCCAWNVSSVPRSADGLAASRDRTGSLPKAKRKPKQPCQRAGRPVLVVRRARDDWRVGEESSEGRGGGRGGEEGGEGVDGARERERERERLVRDLPFRFSQRNRRYGRIYLFVCVCVSLSPFSSLLFCFSLSPRIPLRLSVALQPVMLQARTQARARTHGHGRS